MFNAILLGFALLFHGTIKPEAERPQKSFWLAPFVFPYKEPEYISQGYASCCNR